MSLKPIIIIFINSYIQKANIEASDCNFRDALPETYFWMKIKHATGNQRSPFFLRLRSSRSDGIELDRGREFSLSLATPGFGSLPSSFSSLFPRTCHLKAKRNRCRIPDSWISLRSTPVHLRKGRTNSRLVRIFFAAQSWNFCTVNWWWINHVVD